MARTASVLAGALALSGSVSAGVMRVRHNPNNLISGRQEEPAPGEEALIETDGSESEAQVLKPIRPDHPAKKVKRDREGSFDIMQEEYLYWGGTDGTLAEMYIDMPGEAEGIVDTEYFDDLVESMDCPREGNTTNQLVMNFVDEVDLSTAQGVWDWVNQGEDNHFMLMVGEGDCGWNTERIVYNVHDMEIAEGGSTLTLDVDQTTWKEQCHTYDLSVGRTFIDEGVQQRLMAKRSDITPESFQRRKTKRSNAAKARAQAKRSEKTSKRQLFDFVDDAVNSVQDGVSDAVDAVGGVADDVADGVGDAVDSAGDIAEDVANEVEEAVGGVVENVENAIDETVGVIDEALDGEFNPDFEIPFEIDVTGKGISFNAQGVDLSGTCADCVTTGSFNVEAKFAARLTEFEEAWVEVSTPGIEATAVIGLTIKGDITDTLASQSVRLFSFSPAGVAIPGVVGLGPVVSLSLEAEISAIRGGTTMNVGGTATIPESFSRLDFLSEEGSESEGWEPEFDPVPLEVEAFVEARASLSLQAAVGLELSALETGFAAEIAAAVPALTALLRAVTSTGCTVCDGFRNGIQGTLTLGTSITATIKQKTGGQNRDLFSISFFDGSLDPLAEFCQGIGNDDDCPGEAEEGIDELDEADEIQVEDDDLGEELEEGEEDANESADAVNEAADAEEAKGDGDEGGDDAEGDDAEGEGEEGGDEEVVDENEEGDDAPEEEADDAEGEGEGDEAGDEEVVDENADEEGEDDVVEEENPEDNEEENPEENPEEGDEPEPSPPAEAP